MADVSIDNAIGNTAARGVRSLVFVSADIGYCFYIDGSAGPFVYRKTTDGGATWGAAVTVQAAITQISHDVWYDQWTPGDAGTLIHMWYFDSTNDDVFYRTLDTNGDTLGTQRIAFAGASAVGGAGAHVSGAKMRGGNLYCMFDIDAGAEKGLLRSTDGGVNWTARDTGTPMEATLDWAMLFPGNEADNQDCWILYFDASANALTLKMHDDSAATTSESATIATVVEHATDATAQYPFSGSIRHSDGHLILAVCTERDTATADDLVFDINGTGSITEKTAITTNIDDHYYPLVFIDQTTDDIYIAYNGKRDGSEVLDTTTKVYYTKSTDGGATWSAGDTAYMEGAAGVVRQVWTPLMGSRFCASWRVGTTLNFNKVNSVTFAAGTTVSVPVRAHIYSPLAPKVSAQVKPAQVTHTYTAQTPKFVHTVRPAQVVHTYTALVPQVRARVQPGTVDHSYIGVVPAISVSINVRPDPVDHQYVTVTPQVRASVAPAAVSHVYEMQTPQANLQIAVGPVTHTYTAIVPGIVGGAAPGAVVIPPQRPHRPGRGYRPSFIPIKKEERRAPREPVLELLVPLSLEVVATVIVSSDLDAEASFSAWTEAVIALPSCDCDGHGRLLAEISSTETVYSLATVDVLSAQTMVNGEAHFFVDLQAEVEFIDHSRRPISDEEALALLRKLV